MKKNLLVFPCGDIAAGDIYGALKDHESFEVYGASSILDHGEYVYKNYIKLPNISEETFVDRLNEVISQYGITDIIPTHDSVALYLVANQEKICCQIISSDLYTNEICRFKHKTYSLFEEDNFVPKIYAAYNSVDQLPVFLKPTDGQGAKNTFFVDDEETLRYLVKQNPDHLISEYLPGEELTIDCFTNRHGELLFIGPRSRDLVFSGISVRSTRFPLTEEIESIVITINQKLNFRGYWFVQLKKDKHNKFKLLELSTRLAGTYSLNRSLDINFPLLSVLDFADVDIEILPNNYDIQLDRTFMNRYKIDIDYQTVYIDFEKTIVSKNSLNKYIVSFLYQCINQNKELILMACETSDVSKMLGNLKLSEKIFDSVILVKENVPKFLYMDKEKKSIFIDNSFEERKFVKLYLEIPSFDTSNIECLFDWKE